MQFNVLKLGGEALILFLHESCNSKKLASRGLNILSYFFSLNYKSYTITRAPLMWEKSGKRRHHNRLKSILLSSTAICACGKRAELLNGVLYHKLSDQ